MAGTAFRKRPVAAQWCFLTFGSPVLEVSWSVLPGVPFLQGVLCPWWQRPASPSFRAQTAARHREVKGGRARPLSCRIFPSCLFTSWTEGWGLEGVPRARPGLLGRVAVVSRSWDPVEDRGLGSRATLRGLLVPMRKGSHLWPHLSPSVRVTGDPASGTPLHLVLSRSSFPCFCFLWTCHMCTCCIVL